MIYPTWHDPAQLYTIVLTSEETFNMYIFIQSTLKSFYILIKNIHADRFLSNLFSTLETSMPISILVFENHRKRHKAKHGKK